MDREDWPAGDDLIVTTEPDGLPMWLAIIVCAALIGVFAMGLLWLTGETDANVPDYTTICAEQATNGTVMCWQERRVTPTYVSTEVQPIQGNCAEVGRADHRPDGGPGRPRQAVGGVHRADER